MREWKQVETDIFGDGNEDAVQAAEEGLRARQRAWQLAQIRKERKLTQKDVAAALGVSEARVSQIEHGQLDRGALYGLAAYIEALGGELELVAHFGDKRLTIG